jgi:hypothetical protein
MFLNCDKQVEEPDKKTSKQNLSHHCMFLTKIKTIRAGERKKPTTRRIKMRLMKRLVYRRKNRILPFLNF